MCYKRNVATRSASVLQKPGFYGKYTIFQLSLRVFSLLSEVFNAAANNLVTVGQCPGTSHMAGLAGVSTVSLPTAHYTVMEAGSLSFPWDFSATQLLCVHYLFVNMHLWGGVDVILLSAWFRQLVSSVLQRQPGSDFSQPYKGKCFRMVSACPPLGQHCRIRLWHKWQLKRKHCQ